MIRGLFRRKGADRRPPAEQASGPAPIAPPAPPSPAPAEPESSPPVEPPPPRTQEIVEQALRGWSSALAALGEEAALADLSRVSEAAVDLTAAHPSGLAQLYAGRPTRLSSLVREPGAQREARRAAEAARATTEELTRRHGIAPVYLALGVATWTELPEADGAVDVDESQNGDVVLEPSSDPRHAYADYSATSAVSASSGDEAERVSVPHAAAGSAAGQGVPTEAPDSHAASGTAPPASSGEAAATPSATSAEVARALPATPSHRAVRAVQAPVLLRPIRMTAPPGSDDVLFHLEAGVEINPVFADALKAAEPGADHAELIPLAELLGEGLSPRKAFERIREVGSRYLAGFELTEKLLVGPFVQPGRILLDDLESMRPYLAKSPVVAALAGDDEAQSVLDVPLPPRVRGDRAPEDERGAGDLDPDQAYAVDVAASGRNVFIDAPPGSDVHGALAALLADAAASGRHSVYVPGSRRTGRALVGRLQEIGLGGLSLDMATEDRWRQQVPTRLAAGLGREPEELDARRIEADRAELVAVRSTLGDYIDGLHAVHDPWGVSAYDALQELARQTSRRPGPRTTVRLSAATLRELSGQGLSEVADLLARAAALDAFTLRPHETPWYGAALDTAAEATAALERTHRLAEELLPDLLDHASRVTRQTGLERARTLRDWSEQLTMLDGVADALDVFHPQIFERSAADMVVATASREWRKERGLSMRASVRRRLRKQARDQLRPGRPVEDLHAELVKVQAKREVWRRHDPSGGWPRLPDGLGPMRKTAEQARADVEALDPVVGSGIGKDELLDLPLGALEDRMQALSRDAAALRLLPERTRVLAELRERGMGELVADLTQRRVARALVGAELDLAWWSSVLEQILRTSPALAGQDGPALRALAERFRELDLAQVRSLAAPIRRAIATQAQEAVLAHAATAQRLEDAAAEEHPDVRRLLTGFGDLPRRACPIWLLAPAIAPQVLPPAPETIDLLVLDGVQHLPPAQVISLIARARQVVLTGDSRRGGEGLAGVLGPLLPTVPLPADRARRHEGIAAFLASHGYDGVISSVPGTTPASQVRLELVEGFGMPAPGREAVESVRSEVDRVVDLVIEHALTAPEESLAVVALNAPHAERVREAVAAAAAGSPALGSFLDPERDEPFTVLEVDAAAGLRRDVVLLSVGYGKTPHGRVLHRFGPIAEPDGLACLVDALDAVRHRLVVVSCLAPGDLDRERLRQPGPQLLADLIDQAASGEELTATADSEPLDGPDQLLVDLAERLWRLGLVVEPRYGIPGGVRVPLAIGHPDLPGELVVAVATDDIDYVAEHSLRRRDRHWVERLEARGWRVRMAFSAAVFMDPQAEAEAIRDEVLDVVAARRLAAAAQGGQLVETSAVIDDGSRGPRPDVPRGLPLAAYSDDQLDELVAWLRADDHHREEATLIEELRAELGLTRRGAQTDAVLGHVVRRSSRELDSADDGSDDGDIAEAGEGCAAGDNGRAGA
ncbi:DNA helicase [Bogoriella caseilytica]|uniref:DNA helicase n=1 Tax=Bogoriella caseilytica TaxID=56055 RepID=A0A3N2BDS0_9MICO|nr:DNA helicase [Bogoriella caseilytica]ROR73397.1 hypothetical protein EDD31_1775 [Bogoriella caseilytica]